MARRGRPPIELPTTEEAERFRARDEAFLADMRRKLQAQSEAVSSGATESLPLALVSPSPSGVPGDAVPNGLFSLGSLKLSGRKPVLSPELMSAEMERLRKESERIAKLCVQIELWNEEDAARRHLERLGVERSLDLLRQVLGRAAVDKAFRAPGATPAPRGREFFIWLNVELDRAARRTTVEQTCRRLARIGIRGWHEDRRGNKRLNTIKEWRTIESLYGAAEKKLRSDVELRQFYEDMVKRDLILWQSSGDAFDVWQRHRLRSNGCVYRETGTTPRLFQRE